MTRLSLILLTLSLVPTLYAQQHWTLDQCVSYALENNLQVKQAQNTVLTSEADVKQARAALFPSLTFGTNQSLGFQKAETQSFATFDSKVKNPTYSGSYNLSANVTLYDGGANWRTLQQSKLQREASTLQAEQMANNVEVQIIQAYYQILYAHESVETNREIVAVAQQELDRTKAKVEIGKGTQVDVAQMESQYQQNVYQLVTAQNQEAANVLSLKKLLQLDPASDFSIDYRHYSDDDILALIPSLAEAEMMALGHLPNLRAAELGVKSAQIQTKIAKAGYLPNISLNAGISSGNGNTLPGGFISQVTDHMRENIGLNLSLPIYDNRRTRTAIDRAKVQLSNALINQEDVRLQVQNTIASLHLDIQSAQARYQSAVATESSARQSFELMEERYNVGLETVIDLLTKKNEYLRSRQETLQSKYTALMDLSLLNFYLGR